MPEEQIIIPVEANQTPPQAPPPLPRDERGRILPGNRGRLKGAVNRVNRTVRETLLDVFNDLQTDPVYRLSAWARSNPDEFYRLAGKLIPLEISGSVEHVIRVERTQNPDAVNNSTSQPERIPASLQPPE